jgi:hypothetical protein
MRKRGPSGGGTLRSGSPQLLHRSSPNGPAGLARSQWPRASQCGLMHCTVHPGRYCIRSPKIPFAVCWTSLPAPVESLSFAASEASPREVLDGADSAAARMWCQAENLLSLVVLLLQRLDTFLLQHSGRTPAQHELGVTI